MKLLTLFAGLLSFSEAALRPGLFGDRKRVEALEKNFLEKRQTGQFAEYPPHYFKQVVSLPSSIPRQSIPKFMICAYLDRPLPRQ